MYYVNEGSVLAIGIIFPVLCSICVLMRFLARARMNVGLGPDDWLALVALVFTLGCGAIMITGAATDTLGWHSPPQSAAQYLSAGLNEKAVLTAKLKTAFFPLMIIAIGLIRLTLVFLYRRIFRGKIIQTVNWVFIGVIIFWTIAFFFAVIFGCGSHFSAYWTTGKTYQKYCWNNTKINAAMTLTDVIIDIGILILPIKPVWDLNMSTHRKFLVLIVFGLGIFSIAAGTARMVLLWEVAFYDYGSNDKLFGLAGTSDPIGVIGTGLWWSYMEIGIGCLVSNMPAVVGFFRGGMAIPFLSLIAQVSLHSLQSIRRGSKGSGTKNGSKEDVGEYPKGDAHDKPRSEAMSEESSKV